MPQEAAAAGPVDRSSDPAAPPAGEDETASVAAPPADVGPGVPPEIVAVPPSAPGLPPEPAGIAPAAPSGSGEVAVGGPGTPKGAGRRTAAAIGPAAAAAPDGGGPVQSGVPVPQSSVSHAPAAASTEPGATSDVWKPEGRDASTPVASEPGPLPVGLDAPLPRGAGEAQLSGSAVLPPASATSAAPAVSTAGTHPVVSNVALSAVPIEIGMKGLAGISRFDIRLAPEDLGRVDVRLDIAEDGRVRAHLTVDRPETLAWLHRETGQLERALGQAGLRTEADSVGVSLRDPATGGDGQRAGDGNGRERADRPAAANAIGVDEGAVIMPSRRTTWSRASGIDRRI